ncbi:MAG: FtsH-binding integral membrane protein [Paracoccaceae bacterium]|jgi:FtsH-binding integral membrane protein
MADYQNIRTTTAGTRAAQIDAGLREHMNKVYGLMSVGMLLTAGVAWSVGTSDVLLSLFRDTTTLKPNLLGYAAMFAPLVMIFAFSAMINRLSASAAQLFFYAFASAMGLSLAWIFKAFTGISIAQTFLITAISFASLSLYGYTTKRDLSAFGTFLIMGLVGLLLASVINIFIVSSALSFAISVLGVLIFAGLTAYDTQKIKNTYLQNSHQGNDEWLAKSAIMGALNLYMDFLNLFMFLLHFLGNRE